MLGDLATLERQALSTLDDRLADIVDGVLVKSTSYAALGERHGIGDERARQLFWLAVRTMRAATGETAGAIVARDVRPHLLSPRAGHRDLLGRLAVPFDRLALPMLLAGTDKWSIDGNWLLQELRATGLAGRATRAVRPRKRLDADDLAKIAATDPDLQPAVVAWLLAEFHGWRITEDGFLTA